MILALVFIFYVLPGVCTVVFDLLDWYYYHGKQRRLLLCFDIDLIGYGFVPIGNIVSAFDAYGEFKQSYWKYKRASAGSN